MISPNFQETDDATSLSANIAADASSFKSEASNLKIFKFFDKNFCFSGTFSVVTEDIVADSLDTLMKNKLIKEKRLEMEKKLESLKKKHAKVSFFLESKFMKTSSLLSVSGKN